MTQSSSPEKQRGFLDLRQQIAEMACNTTTPADETGQLPGQKASATPRPTLHLHHAGQADVEGASHTTATRTAR